ncbi:hypothetical protein EMCRGX_G014056 [Ephydatia muelleri]
MAVSLKVVIVGDGAMGKTSFAISWATNTFPSDYVPTRFDNFSANVMVEGVSVTLILWDPGLVDYDRLRPLYYPETDVFLIAFSVDRKVSYENVRLKWLPEIKHHCPNTPWLLLGLKADLRSSSEHNSPGREFVTEQAARDMAKELGAIGYFECSSLTLSGLSNAMDSAARASLSLSGHTSNRKRFNFFRKRRTTDPSGDTTSEPAIPPPPTLPENEKAPSINVSTSTFPGDWKKLVNCEDLSDVTFLLGSKVFYAHKYVLCGASNMFRRVFGIQDTIKTTSIGEFPTWNKKRMQEVTPENICGGKVAGLKDIQYSVSINPDKLVTKITLDKILISDVPFLRCLEFLYTGIVELEAKSTLMDETMKVAELFNLPELQTICENAKKGDEFIPFNSTIGTWLRDRKREIAKQLFLYQPLFSDVRLMVEGKIIHAHKVVFLARCDVLSAMFKGGFVEADRSEVELHDITYENMLAFLEYLYTDHCSIQKGDSVGILVLSNEYMMPRLTSLCELCIKREVDRTTSECIAQADIDVISLLLTAQLHNANQLSAWCLHFISSNYAEFSSKPEFSLLTGDNLAYVQTHQWPPVSYLEAMEEYRKKYEVDRSSDRTTLSIPAFGVWYHQVTDHVVPDELHLFLRLMDVLIANLISYAVELDIRATRKQTDLLQGATKVQASIQSYGVSFQIWKKKDNPEELDWTSLGGMNYQIEQVPMCCRVCGQRLWTPNQSKAKHSYECNAFTVDLKIAFDINMILLAL